MAGSSGEESEADLWVTWEDYHRAIEALALMVHRSAWQFDQVLCLARGGLRVGDVLSRLFEKPLAILSTSSYREAAGTVRGTLDIAQHISITQGTFGGRVLLVDDLVDSGVTLKAVAEHLKGNYPAVTDLRTAVLWRKAHSSVSTDYAFRVLDGNPWIHQPFEIYDGLGLAALAKRH
jgi:hypoxanthine phosphoribosyltransferase